MKKKTIFTINVNHSIDLITNSSSELFVLQGQTKEIVEELVRNVYPDYKNEYEDVKHISEMSASDLDNFFSYATGSHIWPANKNDYRIPNGFTFEEVYEPDGKEPAWNKQIQYKVKNNDPNCKWGNFVTEENKEWFLNKFDPERKLFFLYSLDENPNWDMQEKLMEVGERYHLG
jgi:hypothetical protein